MFLEFISVLVAAIVLGYVFLVPGRSKPQNLPPGPRGLPVIGNLLQAIKWAWNNQLHLEIDKAAKQYGKIFSLKIFNQPIVVISSASMARHALRHDDFAGRPSVFLGEYLGAAGKCIGTGDFTATLILQRKIAHMALRLYNPYIQENVYKDVEELSKRFLMHEGMPVDIKNDVDMARINHVYAMVFGKRYKIEDPELRILTEKTKSSFAFLHPAKSINFFPFLINFPMKDSRAIVEYKKFRDRLIQSELKEHKASYQEGVIRDLTDAIIKSVNDLKKETCNSHNLITDEHVSATIMELFATGFQGPTMELGWCIIYMINHPEVQRKAQQQLDDVIGHDVMPRLEDRARLPYLDAIIAETLRLSTTGPFGVPHKAIKDSTLEGFHIPKDTIVVFNIWAFHHDEQEWDNPDEFKPERFLDSEGRLRNEGSIQSYLPFSAGKRGCVAAKLAKQEFFLLVSQLLHKFTFEKAEGEPNPDMQGTAELIIFRYPSPFKVCIRKRH